MKPPRIVVLGDGGWGTALAVLLVKKGYDVTLWSAFPEYAKVLESKRENVKFLPGVRLPGELDISASRDLSLGEFDFVVAAVPTQYMRRVLDNFRGTPPPGQAIVSVAKGIENGSLLRPSEIIAQVLEAPPTVALSGPSHAEEVVRGLPATVVAACSDEGLARQVQETFTTDRFRVYTNADLLGVELAGATKNVVAIACGICDGLGLGDNAKAALLTRGLAEITRLGVAMGARRETFSGLAGIGDLITTCASPYGRNHRVGMEIGKGKKLPRILESMQMVAEGVDTTKSVRMLAQEFDVGMPITREVYRVLFEDKDPRQAVNDLMSRRPRQEADEL